MIKENIRGKDYYLLTLEEAEKLTAILESFSRLGESDSNGTG